MLAKFDVAETYANKPSYALVVLLLFRSNNAACTLSELSCANEVEHPWWRKINTLANIFLKALLFINLKSINVKINFGFITVVTTMLCVTGCISTKKFNALQANYNKLYDTNSQLTREGEQCKSNLDRATVQISGLQEQINSEREHAKSLQAALEKCLTSASQGNVNISKLVDEINSSN
ncbi:MAG: hypothetical protein ABJA71_14245, partial [Ginsengibacter sp.]